MNKTFLHKNILFFLISFFSIIFIVIGYKKISQEPTFIEFYENVNIYINNEKQEETNLKTFELDKKLKKNDIAILELTLNNIKDKSIAIYSRHAEIEVYENDELIYEYHRDTHRKHKTLDGRYHIIELKDSDKTTLKIKHIIGTTDTVDEFKPIYIDSSQNIVKSIFNKNFVNSLISIILFIGGILMLIIGFLQKTNRKEKNTIISLGFFIILTSTWSLCESGILPIFLKETIRFKILENFSFFCLVIPFCAYVYNIVDKNMKERKILKTIIITTIIYNILVFTLDFLDILSVRNTLKIMHAIIVLAILLTIKICVKYKTIQTKYLTVGLVYLTTVVFINLIFFYTNDILKDTINLNLTIVGLFIFTISILSGYFKHLIDLSAKAKETEILSKIAYHDSLTNLCNRAKYEKDLDEFTSEDICGVIFYDLNKLKITNDTLGHEKGDELITNFSNILKEISFDFNSTAYRLGGDEFVVIFKNKKRGVIEDFAKTVNKKIIEENNKNEIKVSVSYGISLSSEESKKLKIRDIVKLADERMYVNKISERQKKEED